MSLGMRNLEEGLTRYPRAVLRGGWQVDTVTSTTVFTVRSTVLGLAPDLDATTQGALSGAVLAMQAGTAANLGAERRVASVVYGSDALTITLSTALPAQPNAGDVCTLYAETTPSATHVASNATTTVKQGPGVLERIVVNNPGSSWTCTVYDSTTGSGAVIAALTPGSIGTLEFDAIFVNGLTLVTSGTTAGDLTVIWR